jgi:hypothetical protein
MEGDAKRGTAEYRDTTAPVVGRGLQTGTEHRLSALIIARPVVVSSRIRIDRVTAEDESVVRAGAWRMQTAGPSTTHAIRKRIYVLRSG